jgi:hypothetical protein
MLGVRFMVIVTLPADLNLNLKWQDVNIPAKIV